MFGMCFCSLRYPALNMHVPYCHLLPVWLYSIFPHYVINCRLSDEKVTEYKMCVFIFSTTFVWNISYSEKNSVRNDQKCVSVCTYSTHYSCHILMKTEFFPHIFEKYPNIKFHENLSSGSRAVPCGCMDGQDEANCHYLMNTPNNVQWSVVTMTVVLTASTPPRPTYPGVQDMLHYNAIIKRIRKGPVWMGECNKIYLEQRWWSTSSVI
jgi:hypothetical protein